MSDFEKFARSQGFSGDFQRGCNGQYKSDLLHFMEKSFAHQQAKIDDLEKQLDMMKYINDEQGKNIQNAFKTIEIEQGFKDELQKRVDGALFEMQQLSLMLSKDIDGYEDPAQICQSEGVDMGVRILEKALRGAND